MKSEHFSHNPQAATSAYQRKGVFYFWRLYHCSHNAPGGFCLIAFVGRVTNTSLHLLPLLVAPPETTAGGGAASSAPHPFTLHPFQASTCPEMHPGSQAPPSQRAHCTSELEGVGGKYML